jgi:hypothetical protein
MHGQYRLYSARPPFFDALGSPRINRGHLREVILREYQAAQSLIALTLNITPSALAPFVRRDSTSPWLEVSYRSHPNGA